jgi:DNA repair photolyase
MNMMYEIVQHYANNELVREYIAPFQVIETLGDTVRGIDENGDIFRGKATDYYADIEAAKKAMKS